MADQLETNTKFKNGAVSAEEGGAKIKDEPHDEQEEDDGEGAPPAFGPASLGLHRVGTKLPPKPVPIQPVQVLNARGMPARIRKKNRFFFDDDIVNAKPPRASPKTSKSPKITPVKTPSKVVPTQIKKRKAHSPKTVKLRSRDPDSIVESVFVPLDRKVGQTIGMRLRNLLKLPKAHKWVCYEWFYSNIDKTLFDGENDFMICLKESFPQLKTRLLTRAEWTKTRRVMGKPRRCSQAFFEEERRELERKRQKIRFLQQRKPGEITNCKDLPNEIPTQLVLGTKVTARLRRPQDGLFTGSIDAVDTSNNTYRITFDRLGLGTHSVPDYEVLSNDPPETLTLSSMIQKFRPRPTGSYLATPHKTYSKSQNEEYYDRHSASKRIAIINGDSIGGFPVKLLELIVRINKILSIKKTKIRRLSEMNTDLEKILSFGEPMPDDFERRYAGILVEVEKMNRDLQEFLSEVQGYCQEIAPEPSVAAMLAPSFLREKCREEATKMVRRNNSGGTDKVNVANKKATTIITDLTALLLQIRSLSDSDQNSYELKVLQGTMEEIKAKLSIANRVTFQNCVEVHMQHIQLGLSQKLQNSMSIP